jgi:hypothetical protein
VTAAPKLERVPAGGSLTERRESALLLEVAVEELWEVEEEEELVECGLFRIRRGCLSLASAAFFFFCESESVPDQQHSINCLQRARKRICQKIENGVVYIIYI